MQYESFIRLVRTFTEHEVRFVMIGVGAANLYARTGAEVFSTSETYRERLRDLLDEEE